MGDWSDTAVTLAEGLAGELPKPLNVIGSALLAQAFPGSAPLDWTQIATAFGAIVHEELDQQFFDQSAGEIQGIMNYMTVQYVDDKAGGTAHASLWESLDAEDQKLSDLMGIFAQQRYLEGGLNNFVVAANVHFAVLQEKALIDPQNPGKPNSSGAAKAIPTLVDTYTGMVDSALRQLRVDRINMIGNVQSDLHTVVTGRSWKRFGTVYFDDAFTGVRTSQYGEEPTHGETLGQALLFVVTENTIAKTTAGATFDTDVAGKLDPVKASWATLKSTPVPTPAA